MSVSGFVRRTALAGLLALTAMALAPRALAQNFTNVPIAGLPGVSQSAIAWGDYDNDGRLDFLLTGSSSGGAVAQLWRNTGIGFTNVTASVAPGMLGVAASSVAWGDYDNDGRLDFILTGSPINSGVSQIWRNTGNGFTNVTATAVPGLPGVSESSVAWGDYDNDGRLDFILTGNIGGNGVSQIWRNTGSGFTNVTASVAPGLPGVFQCSVAWGDYDNDGRLDFILEGLDNTSRAVSQIWRNTGSGFTNVTASIVPGLPGVRAGSIAWGDYDNDGLLDFLITGAPDQGQYVSQLWHNTGSNFINVTASVASGLPGVNTSSVAWGDYDNDGRLDFILTGYTGLTPITQLRRNTGTNFVNVTTNDAVGLPTVYLGSIAWGDYDNDGRLDFLFTGQNGQGRFSQLWRNISPVTNTPPTAPSGLSVTPTTNGVLLAWHAASDAQTPSAGLSYNVRAGTTPGGTNVIAALVNASTGFRLVPALGDAQMRLSLPVANVPLGQKVYWSVQAIDTAFAGGPFAAESVFTNGFALVSVPGLAAGESAAWGDYDNDGWLDVLVTGFGVTKLWRNTGSTFTNVPIADLPGLANTAVAWSDFDNDGRLDFIITGSTDGFETGATSQLWRNTGSGFSNVTASQLAGLPGLYLGTLSWGDYNHDGRPDLVVSGSYDDGNGVAQVSQLWRNTGSNFVNVTASVIPGLPGNDSSTLAWADYDGDGRLDLLAAGGNVPQLWRNTGSNFVNVAASLAPGLSNIFFGTAAWGDYDNDGRPDFMILGTDPLTFTNCFTQLWRNTGSGFTNVPIAGIREVSSGNVSWGDYDGDGRLDFLVNGAFNLGVSTSCQLWRNTGTGFAPVPFSGLSQSVGGIAWADYDNDGQLDLLVGGQLWHNQLGVTNTPPTAPTGLAMTRTANAALLSWSAATDAQTPSSGLTYNVRAGTTPGGTNLLAALVNAGSGFRRVAARGNAEQRQFLPLLGVTNSQPIYWSVQAVDNSFAGGQFASESSAVTTPMLAIVPSSATNAIVSWSPPTWGWRLQESTNLTPGGWGNSASGELNPVTIPGTNSAKFFRLTTP